MPSYVDDGAPSAFSKDGMAVPDPSGVADRWQDGKIVSIVRISRLTPCVVVLSTVSAVRFMPGDEYFLVLRSEIRKVPGFLDLVRDGCSPKLRPIIWGYLSGTVERYLSA